MVDALYQPVTDPDEIRSLLEEVPLAIDRERFTRFALGFPRRYFLRTSALEIVKHCLLVDMMGQKELVSSLYREGDQWKLCVVTRDRSHLFSRIAGTLSCFHMNISSAEAFANSNSLVLDSFLFHDPQGRFFEDSERKCFQKFLEDVLKGNKELEPVLKKLWQKLPLPEKASIEVTFEEHSHPTATLVKIRGRDHVGLLYLISRSISTAGYSIDVAYIQTIDQRACDVFYITCKSQRLNPQEQQQLKRTLEQLEPARLFQT